MPERPDFSVFRIGSHQLYVNPWQVLTIDVTGTSAQILLADSSTVSVSFNGTANAPNRAEIQKLRGNPKAQITGSAASD